MSLDLSLPDWRPLSISLQVGVAATGISLLLGTFIGHWLANRHRSWVRQWGSALMVLPLALPPTVLGWYLLVVIGRRGPVGQAYELLLGEPLVFTRRAAVLAACATAIPIVARQMAAAFASTPQDVLEAARLDGAGRLAMLARVQLPLVWPSLGAAAAVAFSRAVGDFGATLMVAGNLPGRTQTAALAVYDLVNAGRDAEATALIAAMTIIALVVLLVVGGNVGLGEATRHGSREK